MELYSLMNEEMQKDIRELLYLPYEQARKSKFISRVEALRMFLDRYELGTNKCVQRPENTMKLLTEVGKRLLER